MLLGRPRPTQQPRRSSWMFFIGNDFVLWEIRRLLHEAVRYLKEIRLFFPLIPTGVRLVQFDLGGNMPGAGSNNINQGGSGVFQAQPLPAGASFPPGTQFAWSSDNPKISFAVAPGDTSGATQTVTDDPSDTATSANLSVAVQLPGSPAPAVLTAVLAITITPVTPPPPTGVQISQLS